MTAYSITSEDGQLVFNTDQGDTYCFYTTEADGYAPSASFADKILMFGFNIRFEGHPRQRNRGSNKRTLITLFKIIETFFTEYPDFILVYLCDKKQAVPNTNGRQIDDVRIAIRRQEIFNNWYAEWQTTKNIEIKKKDFILYGTEYCGCLYKAGNPYEEELISVIEHTKLFKHA